MLNFLTSFIDDIGITMNVGLDHAVEFLGEITEFINSVKNQSIDWNVTEHYSHWKNRAEDGIKRN